MSSHQRYQKVATEPTELASTGAEPGHSTRNPLLAPIATPEYTRMGGDGDGKPTLANTQSSQQLMSAVDNDSVTASIEESTDTTTNTQDSASLNRLNGWPSPSHMKTFTVAVLCFVNLINYMDRFTVAGVLTDIQVNFDISNDLGGLLQTVFVISYMVFAPAFGYLGDRYSRKWIMLVGIALWSGTTLLGSFMNSYGWFLCFRALVGIGEASYSTIAPTLISDLFLYDMRSKMLALFYFAIPVGSGLGYIVGSETAKLMGSWRWALRVTPILGVVAIVLIYFIREPERGQSEGSQHMRATSYKDDLIAISKNPSFMLSTIGFTCVAFVTGALAWWGPKFMHLGMQLQPGGENTQFNDISIIFGAIAMAAGIVGVPLGAALSQWAKKRWSRGDPIICGTGLVVSAPCLALAMLLVSKSAVAAYLFMFFGQVALNLNWAIVADILLYVVVPTRRSTAEAFQILISHAFGDACSPYLVGVISDALKSVVSVTKTVLPAVFGGLTSYALTLGDVNQNSTESPVQRFVESRHNIEIEFKSLQYALFTTSFIEVLGGVFFFITAFYIIRDRDNAARAVQESLDSHHTDSSEST